MSATVADLGEHALIEHIRARAGSPPAWLTVGIGDDAAVLRPDRNAAVVLTADSLVEGVHFRREWTNAAAIGHKALAVNLSDLAAMGAEPRAALLSLALPPSMPFADFTALVDGFLSLARANGAALAGGNITRSPGPLVVDVTATGSVHPRRVLLRSGGRAGDELYVTGALGGAAAALHALERGENGDDPHVQACRIRYERPEPRVRCGVTAARSRATQVAIDVSDGLSDAVTQLARASGTGAVVIEGDVPVDAAAASVAARLGRNALDLALHGGEDYEIVFAVSPRRRRGFLAAAARWTVPITRIGRLTAEPGVWLDRPSGREPLGAGFVHF